MSFHGIHNLYQDVSHTSPTSSVQNSRAECRSPSPITLPCSLPSAAKMITSTSAPASPVAIRLVERPQVNIRSPSGGNIFPLLAPQYPLYSPHRSNSELATGFQELWLSPGPVESRKKGFKSSISGTNFVSGLRRAFSTSVVNTGKKNKTKSVQSELAPAHDNAMKSTGQLSQSPSQNELAVSDESDYISTDLERSLPSTREASPRGEKIHKSDSLLPTVNSTNSKDTEHKTNREDDLDVPKPAAINGFQNTLRWTNNDERPRRSANKILQPSSTASSWFRGRGTEKETSKPQYRQKSLELKRDKSRREGMIFDLEVEDESGQSINVYRTSSLRDPNSNRFSARKTSLPEAGQSRLLHMERAKIASREVMIAAQEKLREKRWVKAINAWNSDVWSGISTKTSNSSGIPSTVSTNSIDPITDRNDLSNLYNAGSEEPDTHSEASIDENWCNSSSEDEETDFQPQGLRPRPVPEKEQSKERRENQVDDQK